MDFLTSKYFELVSNGAQYLQPQEIAENSDIVFLMLGFPHDVESMVLDSEKGILSRMK